MTTINEPSLDHEHHQETSVDIEQDFTIYEWINDEFLLNIIEEYEQINDKPTKTIKLLDHSVKSATLKGDNYASALFRAKLQYSMDDVGAGRNQLKNVSFILKARLDNDAVNEIIEEYNVFQRESQVYKYILKHSTELLQSIGDNTNFGPKLIYLDERVIVLEDLLPNGYRLKNPKQRLNLYESKLVMEKVAKFHACSAVLHAGTQSELFKYNIQSNITEKFNPLHLVYQNTIKSAIKYCKTQLELQPYVDKLIAYETVIIEKLIKVFKRDDAYPLNILNHGDLWINNLMFKHNKLDKVVDVLLVDYQEGFYGSPGIDLNWFLYSSCNDAILSSNQTVDELLQYYYKILCDTLTKLKYNKIIPTFEQIQMEINKKGDHGLITLLCMAPIFIIENKEYATAVNFIMDTDECEKIRDIVFSNPEYGKLLIKYLPKFIESGHL